MILAVTMLLLMEKPKAGRFIIVEQLLSPVPAPLQITIRNLMELKLLTLFIIMVVMVKMQ